MAPDALIQCHACGLLQRNPPLPAGGAVRCGRCATMLRRHIPEGAERALALILAGLILFVIANGFPLLSIRLQGQTVEMTLFTGIETLYRQGMWPLSLVVFFTGILAPGIRLVLLLSVLIPLGMNRVGRGSATRFRYAAALAPWGMLDVFLLGLLVSVVKLADQTVVIPGTSLFAFVVLIFVLAAAQVALSGDPLWSRLPVPAVVRRCAREGVAKAHPWAFATWARGFACSCHVCKLVTMPGPATDPRPGRRPCPRCGAGLHRRKPESLQRTWALVIAAGLCYLPANLLPIMTSTRLGETQADTILSGVIFLLREGMWPLALVVLVASVLVPLTKLAILVYLLVSVHRRSTRRPGDRTRLYRITEAVGRWSMVDIYVVTVLAALVRLGNLATVEAGPGAVFFAAVVVITLFAARAFDPRLIWDRCEQTHDGIGAAERTA
ncbi:MAG: PqiA/YebS family transporter subunit [Candidatus Thiosymbion ectosymbiont of Robbea hypermnestra]|nr:PqiA/YebS family transporter subunit [Candidatus Thiosymbion ectosymbiont of Robbea hypermnestra]